MMKVRGIRCEVYSRIVGYYTPVETWHLGKREEFKDRVPIDLDTLGSESYDRAEEEEHD